MKAIEYFNKIEEFANLKDKEGFEAFEKCLYGLNKEDLLELIVEFTSIIAKADVSLDIIEDPTWQFHLVLILCWGNHNLTSLLRLGDKNDR